MVDTSKKSLEERLGKEMDFLKDLSGAYKSSDDLDLNTLAGICLSYAKHLGQENDAREDISLLQNDPTQRDKIRDLIRSYANTAKRRAYEEADRNIREIFNSVNTEDFIPVYLFERFGKDKKYLALEASVSKGEGERPDMDSLKDLLLESINTEKDKDRNGIEAYLISWCTSYDSLKVRARQRMEEIRKKFIREEFYKKSGEKEVYDPAKAWGFFERKYGELERSEKEEVAFELASFFLRKKTK